MKISKIAVISVLFSIVGVGFIFFESGNITPIVARGPLESYVGDYMSFEGVVCRKYESNGNLFLVLRGEHEVEVPIFYGLREKLSIEPKLGDWVYVQGTLNEVPQKYMRQYWPRFSISVEEPFELDIQKFYPAYVDIAEGYGYEDAGRVYSLNGKVKDIEGGYALIGDVKVPFEDGMGLADIVDAKVLVLEDDRSLCNLVLSLNVSHAELSELGSVDEIGEPYLASGRIASLKPYYGGVLLEIEDGKETLDIYIKGMADIFFKDTIEARGIFRIYRGNELLYVNSPNDVYVSSTGEISTSLPEDCGEREKVSATIASTYLVGRHKILNILACGVELPCHLYSKEIGDMEKLGKDIDSLIDGREIIAYLEIIECKDDLESKLLDFIIKK